MSAQYGMRCRGRREYSGSARCTSDHPGMVVVSGRVEIVNFGSCHAVILERVQVTRECGTFVQARWGSLSLHEDRAGRADLRRVNEGHEEDLRRSYDKRRRTVGS